ncbi:MAG: hypothetical protein R3F61_10760 [Myxococcota bacterium]
MNGDIVGATTPSDDRLILRRIRISGALPYARLGEVEAQVASGEPVFGILLDAVDGPTLDGILFDRFRDNLIGFVAATEEPRFEALLGVFVDNMQMGQNAARLIDTTCKDADLAMRWPTTLEVGLGEGNPRDDLEATLMAVVTETPTPIGELVLRSTLEPWTGRAVAAAMLDSGALVPGRSELTELEPEPLDEPADELEESVSLEDLGSLASEAAPTSPDPGFDAEPPDLESGDMEPLDEPEPEADDDIPELDDDVTFEPLPDELTGDAPDADDEPAPSPDADADAVSPGDDLSRWLDTGEQISEEDMAFFEDHESDRGAGDGGFSTETHNLDRVDVGPPGSPPPEEVLEADEAPSAKFSAPVLSEADALEKIEVCNDVLRRVTSAFDAAAGAGRGRAQIQLLVDGSPSKYTALLHDLTVLENGELPADDLLDNLAGRPPSEHRQLINSALKNVIERALSSAADDLPEDSFDDVYESVAGYNKRLGL